MTTLVVSDGIISVSGGNTTGPGSISYGDLIGGNRFNVTLTGKNTDTTTGIAKLKPVQEMKNVGKSPRRWCASARTVIEADYDVPFQGHTAIGPAHAMADPSNDQMTIYTNDMKSYGMRNGVAEFLKMPRDRGRVIWMDGPQGYGRTAADDAGFEAAYLAKEIGRPVRVQWSRQEETAWDTKVRPMPSRCAAASTRSVTWWRCTTTRAPRITIISATTNTRRC